MSNNTIIYVGRFGLPNTAPGLRVYNIAKVIKSIGYLPKFISTMGTKHSQQENVIYDSFDYKFTNLCKTKNKFIRTASNLTELLTARKSYQCITEICKKDKPHAIILYNDLYPLTKKLLRFCRINDILLFADVTEWYEKRKYRKLGDWIIPFWTNKRIRKLDSQLSGIIAISDYLYDYYQLMGCKNIVCIPPLFDVPENLLITRHQYGKRQSVNLIYAGSPGSKDILKPIFEALEKINNEIEKIRFDVIGIDEKQIISIWKNTTFKDKGIYAHGRLPHDRTLEIVKSADFGMLLREDKRYAKAGYSTKFVECMINGVAMICNKVGGTDRDIKSGYNGFFVKTNQSNDIIELFNMLISLSNEDICQIKKNAYCFSYTKYNAKEYKHQLTTLMSQGGI